MPHPAAVVLKPLALSAPGALLALTQRLLRAGFRRSNSASAWWNVCKTLAHTSFFYTTFLVVLPSGIHALETLLGVPRFTLTGQREVALVGFIPLTALGLTSGITMAVAGQGTPLPLDAPNALVVRGPYRYVRNPMAIAGLGQGAMIGLGLGSWGILGYVAAGGLLWNYLVRPIEEDDLSAQFGAEFAHYRAEVPCWIPRTTPYTPPARMPEPRDAIAGLRASMRNTTSPPSP